jgi:MoxR-like ATPase
MNHQKWQNIIKNNILADKEEPLELILAAFLADGHVLIEDVPGVGKTTLVKYIARALGLHLSRIQFTSDLLPQEILGFNRYIQTKDEFKLIHGPIFGEIILADELNRAPPKTQSALLQAMEEHEVTIDGKHYQLPDPFFVIATQNPLSQIGTFPLPESQLDRFSLKINMGLPNKDSSLKLLSGIRAQDKLPQVSNFISKEEIIKDKEIVKNYAIKENLIRYINELTHASRTRNGVKPLSVRAALDVLNTAKAYAFIKGHEYVLPEHIQKVFPHVCGHRLIHPMENFQIGLEHAYKIIQDTNVI